MRFFVFLLSMGAAHQLASMELPSVGNEISHSGFGKEDPRNLQKQKFATQEFQHVKRLCEQRKKETLENYERMLVAEKDSTDKK